jgi:Holliday junction resolvasome RuvABC endonuclease subunit
MTVVPAETLRILAIDPTSRGLAFAVLEGSERLVDWGLVELADKSDEGLFCSRVSQLLARYEPAAVVMEVGGGSRRGSRGRDRIACIDRLANGRELPVHEVTRDDLRDAFAGSGATKWEIAVAITRLFPELEAWLPRKRKPWMSEDERMNIFDAVAFGLVALRRAERERMD